jgi:hypothetical protein
MSYFKGVAIGFGTAVLGCIVTPIVMMLWWFGKATIAANKAAPPGPGERMAVSFSPMGLINHFGLTRPSFWLFIIVLFFAGFLSSVYLQKR